MMKAAAQAAAFCLLARGREPRHHRVFPAMTPRKDMAKLVVEARRQGWRTERTRNNHWKLYPPNGGDMVYASGTPGGPRAITKTVAQMRNEGFRWKGR